MSHRRAKQFQAQALEVFEEETLPKPIRRQLAAAPGGMNQLLELIRQSYVLGYVRAKQETR